MRDKSLRIMIADPQHFQRLRLERDFNYQGYYAIAQATSLEEMLKLIEYGDKHFDLVLINACLARNIRFNLILYCLKSSLIRQAVIYSVPECQQVRLSPEDKKRVVLISDDFPDIYSAAYLSRDFGIMILS